MNSGEISRQAAVDLWQQMLDRARSHEWSTFDDPEYIHPGRDESSVRRAFLDAGWSDDEIEMHEKVEKDRIESAPTTSPGVARLTEAALDRLSKLIRGAAKKMNVPNRESVHFAIEPKAGPFVSKVNVVMTDQSIITMGSFFTRYCGLVARAYVRTQLAAPFCLGVHYDESRLRAELRKRPQLLLYWWRIFVSFALTGTHMLAPFKPSNKDEVLLMEQVALSMEVFGLAHEYAHHTLGHGRAILSRDDAHREEFEADKLALDICELVETELRYTWIRGHDVPNPYLWTGSGGILLLSSLEAFRKTKDRIYLSRSFDSHPNFVDRSSKIRSRFVMQPDKLSASMDFCGAVENVLRCVMLELEPMLDKLVPANIRTMAPDDWEAASFR
ncbi:MAG: hypothetical protein K0B16_12410 [Burkholderiaceae bacterium]|nr:hypothetical protein [Burkholderiaceae bacterium]